MVKRLLLIVGIFTLFLVSCQSESVIQESETALNPDTPAQPTQNTESPGSIPTAENQEGTSPSQQIPLSPPTDWFYSQNRIDNLLTLIYTNYNPVQLQSDTNLASIPANFAAGALVISPLPDGSDLEALQAGLKANLDEYGAQDMEGMLYVTHQIGLLDLGDMEGVEFTSATMEVLAGYEALLLEGIINMGGSDQLQAQIWLTWTQTSFVSLFEFSTIESWPSVEMIFYQTRNTIILQE